MTATAIAPGTDVRELFRAAYENRYTWEPGFAGYRGVCEWQQGERCVRGRFQVGADLRGSVDGIDDAEVDKALQQQLWEVCIHRVRRPFEQTHADNTFTACAQEDTGLEIAVGGRNAGDRYRIANDVVTMVHRHIHGTVVTIHTEEITETGSGYLSRRYSSRYSDPASGEPKGPVQHFVDTFVPLGKGGPWVLQERRISTDDGDGAVSFRFLDLEPLA
jgi:Protein of unknown function (DUF3386)